MPRAIPQRFHAAGELRDVLVVRAAADRDGALQLHEAVSARLREEPEAVLVRARASLARMRAVHPGARLLLDEWQCLLRRPHDALLPLLTDPLP